MKIFLNLAPYFKKYRFTVIVGLIFVILANIFQVLNPWVLRNAINSLEDQFSMQSIYKYAAILLVVSTASGFFRFLMRRTIIKVSRYIENDFRLDLYRHFQKLDPTFYDSSRIGDLMARSTSDIEQVRMVIGPALMYTTNTTFGLGFGLTLMLLISPVLTGLIVFVVPVITLIVFIVAKRLHKASKASQEALSDLTSVTQENLAGIRVVKAFRQEESQKSLFREKSSNYRKKNMRVVILQAFFFPFVMMIFGLTIGGILLLGGKLIINDVLKIGDFVAFVSYLMILAWPVVSLGWVVGLVQRGIASMQRISFLFKRQPGIKDDENPFMMLNPDGDIKYENVTLKYNNSDVPALDNISFDLTDGKILGIVGRVGSGKSSLVSSLARLYEVTEGRISVSGIPIKKWKLQDLRNTISFVPQDPLLFSTSIKENILLGKEDSTPEELERALEISRLIQDLDQFPDGLDTEVGERGISLSGGQKQRVSIARAVIRNPKILVLDDALSAVDADTEEMILNNLNKFMKDKTAIIVTHRISSIKHADEIIVLDDGKVSEKGTHDELLKNDGIYCELIKRQRMTEELEGSV